MSKQFGRMSEKKQPVFKQVAELRPGTSGHNLRVKVVESKVVVDRQRGPKGQPLKVAECIVGDQTATIVFTARNEQGGARSNAMQVLNGSYDA